ncbi:MAG: tRNA lysidine(34) synthetase TilS, partial [Thermodesulfobacteriota bacterium]|nr:tRNA lysidine(34) synthetase TilS [Thermodesulfobacteriota bacterium]
MPLPRLLQDLAPEKARFCLDVERFVRQELGLDLDGKTVLASFSCGVDSTALVLSLKYLAPRLGCKVLAAHLNHNLRDEATDEAKKAESFCRELEIPCFTGSEDVKTLARDKGLGLEEAAREARYGFLGRIMAEQGAHVLAVGHHLGDLSEDMLMRLIRGTGWPGLGGMQAWNSERGLLRPLLLTPKESIVSFVKDLGLSWCEDASNTDESFFRNRVRHSILPLFETENPNFSSLVAALWRLARIDCEYFDSQVNALIQEAGLDLDKGMHEEWLLPSDMLSMCDPAVRLRIYKHALERLGPGQALSEGLFKLDKAFGQGQLDKVFQFPGGKSAHI